MLYAILCYAEEKAVGAWTKEEDDACIARLTDVQDRLAAQGKIGPVARLNPTPTARTLKKNATSPLVVDGPFAETKELIAGYTLIQVRTREEALEWTRRFPNPVGEGVPCEVEVRQLYEAEDFQSAVSDATMQRFRDIGMG